MQRIYIRGVLVYLPMPIPLSLFYIDGKKNKIPKYTIMKELEKNYYALLSLVRGFMLYLIKY